MSVKAIKKEKKSDVRKSPAFKNLGKTMVVFRDPKDKNDHQVWQNTCCDWTVQGKSPLAVITKDGFCEAHLEANHEKNRAKALRCDLVIQLSDKELKRWREYKKRHGLNDLQVFEDILGGIREDFLTCANCKTRYSARYSKVIDEIKCPGCHLTFAQAEKKVYPEMFKQPIFEPSSYIDARKIGLKNVEVLSCVRYRQNLQFLISNPNTKGEPDPVDAQFWIRKNEWSCDGFSCDTGKICEHIKASEKYVKDNQIL